jgi:hypothetical protein
MATTKKNAERDRVNNAERDRVNRAYAAAYSGSSKEPGAKGAANSTAYELRGTSKTQGTMKSTFNLGPAIPRNKGKPGTQSGKATKRKK